MEEIQVGEYVRTYDGFIGQVIEINKKNLNYYTIDCKRNVRRDGMYNPHYIFLRDGFITKHSKKPIDLIGRFDFVNGYPVREINGKLCDFDINNMEWIPLEEIDVWESIVTKEQFENIKYKLEE